MWLISNLLHWICSVVPHGYKLLVSSFWLAIPCWSSSNLTLRAATSTLSDVILLCRKLSILRMARRMAFSLLLPLALFSVMLDGFLFLAFWDRA